MNVIGLGDAGCKIADCFSQYSQYKNFKINVDIEGKRCYNIPILETAEEYESYAYPKIKTFFKGLKGETLLIVGGSGKISCGSLRIFREHQKTSNLYFIHPTRLRNARQYTKNARKISKKRYARICTIWRFRKSLSCF